MNEWKNVSLANLIDIIIDYRGKTPLKLGMDWSENGYRALSAKNIKTGKIVNEESIRYANEELYRLWMKDEIQRKDILITSEAPFGQVFYWDSDEKIVLSQRLFCLRIKGANPQYVYYYMTSNEFQKELDGRATGTTVVGLRQPELLKCTIKLPNLESQRRIASILSSLDAKIENNNKINAKLEEIAQNLFKEWFVDFGPFKNCKFVESELGLIPEGWRVISLSQIANFKNGLAMQKFAPLLGEQTIPVLKIKELGMGYCNKNSDQCSEVRVGKEYIINDGDVIFSWSGTLLVDIWVGGKCGLNQHLFKVTSTTYSKAFYFWWTKHHLTKFISVAKDKAVTMGHIKRDELDKAKIILPEKYSLMEYDKLMSPILETIIITRKENQQLATLRDTLLPKLMSGEIEV